MPAGEADAGLDDGTAAVASADKGSAPRKDSRVKEQIARLHERIRQNSTETMRKKSVLDSARHYMKSSQIAQVRKRSSARAGGRTW